MISRDMTNLEFGHGTYILLNDKFETDIQYFCISDNHYGRHYTV